MTRFRGAEKRPRRCNGISRIIIVLIVQFPHTRAAATHVFALRRGEEEGGGEINLGRRGAARWKRQAEEEEDLGHHDDDDDDDRRASLR